jgi:hypothetical protein
LAVKKKLPPQMKFRHRASIAQQKVMSFAEHVIGPATSGRTRWLNPSDGLVTVAVIIDPAINSGVVDSIQ